jgi:hypothetical protein
MPINKLMTKGGRLIEVPPQHTSRKCPRCDHTAKENRPAQADFKSQSCGYENNAYLVGSLNVLAAGQAVVKACGGRGVIPLDDSGTRQRGQEGFRLIAVGIPYLQGGEDVDIIGDL